MGLIGRDYDLVGQILKILRIKEKSKKKKKGIFSKKNCGWTKVQQKYEKRRGVS